MTTVEVHYTQENPDKRFRQVTILPDHTTLNIEDVG
jgi:hypothetical protein